MVIFGRHEVDSKCVWLMELPFENPGFKHYFICWLQINKCLSNSTEGSTFVLLVNKCCALQTW